MNFNAGQEASLFEIEKNEKWADQRINALKNQLEESKKEANLQNQLVK